MFAPWEVRYGACAALLLVVGCPHSPESVPRAADVLRISYVSDPDTLNPLCSGDATSALVQGFVYEPLAMRNMAEPDEFVPQLAERWEFDEDRLEFTIHLRRGVQWHPFALPDGTPLPAVEMTTRDVQFTFDCLLNPHIPATGRADFEDATARDDSERYKIRVETVDRYTFKVRWTKPYFAAEEATLTVPIIPRHVFSIDEQGDLISLDFSSREFAAGFTNHWASTRMCGTGPLVFDDWNRSDRLALTRNDDYWGTPFHFRRLVFSCEPNGYTLLQKLLQNEIDWADIDDKNLYLQSREHPSVRTGKVELRTYDYNGYRYIGYNLRRPFLRDKQVRRALTHAVPIEQIIDVVYKGLATQVTGPFLLASSAYNRNVRPLSFDLAQAQRLLDEAGWRDTNANGTRDKIVDGHLVEAVISLNISGSTPDDLTMAQIIQSNWRRIGVRLEITPVQQALMIQRLRSKDFDAVLAGWSLAWSPDPYQTWYGGNAELSDTPNAIGYRNVEVDRLVVALRSTFDRKRQREMYHRVHELIYDDQPYTFLFAEKQTCGFDGRLQHVNFYRVNPCIDFREWTANSAAVAKLPAGTKPNDAERKIVAEVRP
jgi:peptide/nickel transport system substrate-binding protein